MMTDKAYIVANEEQVKELRKHTDDSYDFDTQVGVFKFPYVLVDSADDGWISHISISYAEQDFEDNLEIVYDGRKENKMKIPENIYNMLVEWRDGLELKTDYVTGFKLHMLNDEVHEWTADTTTLSDNHNRYIAILQWLDDADVFEVEKPKKWVVQSKDTDQDGDKWYVSLISDGKIANITHLMAVATKFDTKEEAESWANAHQEVIEVEE